MLELGVSTVVTTCSMRINTIKEDKNKFHHRTPRHTVNIWTSQTAIGLETQCPRHHHHHANRWTVCVCIPSCPSAVGLLPWESSNLICHACLLPLMWPPEAWISQKVPSCLSDRPSACVVSLLRRIIEHKVINKETT